MSNWRSYTNGNYTVHINLENGTKIRQNNLDHFEAAFPESFDIKITNKCRHGCAFCHEHSTPDGLHGDLLNTPFLSTLHPYTELAIGGGNPLEHPDLEEFLNRCKERELIPSMTVHQEDFLENLDLLRRYRDEKLIYGLGVSISYVTDELISALQEFPNAVCHIIAGLFDDKLIKLLAYQNLKILILGYKQFRKGAQLYSIAGASIDNRIKWLFDNLPDIIEKKMFNTVSFDNLAIEQIQPKRLLSEKEWSEFYMGDDGSHTCYIDLVNKNFAVSSTATARFDLRDSIEEMFAIIKAQAHKAS